MAVRFVDAMTDPKLLGRWFAGPSWDAWRTIYKAADGLLLDAEEQALFAKLAGDRPAPRRPVSELILICGRRAGKSNTSGARATFEAAFRDYSAYLKPGELGHVIYVANDRAQAKVAFGYVRGFFRHNKMLAKLIIRETVDEIELSNGIVIIVATNDYRKVRGRTIVCAIFEEAAFYNDAESANPAAELYNAVKPGMATIPGALLIAPSTGWRRSGWLYEKFQRSFGVDDPDVLVIKAASRDLNPLLPAEIVDNAIAEDPAAAAAEWLGEFRSDLEQFISREVVEAATEWGCFERPFRPYVPYVGFVDPSGGSADSFTLAIAHEEGDSAILDCIREYRPPFSPEGVVEECATVLKAYGITMVHGDAYAGEWPREQFAKRGIDYRVSDLTRSELYLELLPALNSGRVRLLENKRLMFQLCGLERRASRTGKDIVNHAPGGHDDLINAAAGALHGATPRHTGQVEVTTADSLVSIAEARGSLDGVFRNDW